MSRIYTHASAILLHCFLENRWSFCQTAQNLFSRAAPNSQLFWGSGLWVGHSTTFPGLSLNDSEANLYGLRYVCVWDIPMQVSWSHSDQRNSWGCHFTTSFRTLIYGNDYCDLWCVFVIYIFFFLKSAKKNMLPVGGQNSRDTSLENILELPMVNYKTH